jgi:uncharacterized lipoprotein YddW (UPF0748 family)
MPAPRFCRFVSVLVACVLLTPGWSFARIQTEFHVSAAGSDRDPGTREKPFLTLVRARDAVRALRLHTPQLQDTVRVFLHAGTYSLAQPLVLTPEDGGTRQSPTLYAAVPGEHAIVSGGRIINGWKETTSTGRRMLQASLPSSVLSQPTLEQLWVNGSRRPPARMPNSGYFEVDSVPGVTEKTDWMDGQTGITLRKGTLPPSTDVTGAEAVVMNRWVESHLPVASYDTSRNLLRFARRSVFRLEKHDPFYLIHVRSGFDTTGEWFHDTRTGVLFYLPAADESPKSITAVIALRTQLLLVKGDSASHRYVDYLLFRGIEFSHTEWHFPTGKETDSRNGDAGGFVQAATGVPAAIECQWMRNSTFEKCVISHVGTYGLALGEGCRNNRFAECDVFDLGGGGVKVGLKTLSSDSLTFTSHNAFLDNHVHDGGLIFHSAIGIWVGQSPRNRFIHNHLHDFYYSGFSIGWTWGYGPANAAGNLVEMNHVHHIGVLSNDDGPILSDLGGIYTLGNHRGTIIRRNVFHDIGARVYGGWGIYFDEGTTGCVAEDNLVYRTIHAGFHQHYGKDNIVRNNIFAFGKEAQVQRSREEAHTGFAFERNIVVWDSSKFYEGKIQEGNYVFDWNLYGAGRKEFNVDSLPFRKWQEKGFDRHSLVADPMFVNPGAGDFRLKANSPASLIGFQPIDFGPVLSPLPLGGPSPQLRRVPPDRRLLYNNDGSNILMAFDTLTPKLAYTRIDPLAHGGVTTFLHNVNPGQNMGYQSRVANMYHWEHPSTQAKEGWNLLGGRMSDNLARFAREGRDPVEMVMHRARLRGMESLLTFRMNELHDVDKPESPLLSTFWKEHPSYRVGGYAGWGQAALNYALPEVREYFFALLAEVVARYDLEGLELDFMRFPYYFPYRADSMSRYAAIMTDFVRRVRALTDSTARARERTILLTARVPTSLKGCAYVGLDPATWCRDKLIDFLTVAPFLSTETDIPVAEFKSVCGQVPVYTGMEFTIGTRQMTREEQRAAATLLYRAGSDGMYLFNYFTAWDAGLDADTGVLREMADPDSLTGKDKLYTLAIPRYPVPNVSLTSPLPLKCAPGEEKSVTVRVHEPVQPKSVTVRIECSEDVKPEDLQLALNGRRLAGGRTPASAQIFPQKIWPALPIREKTLEFDVDPDILLDANPLTIRALRPLTIEWVYLAVKH